MLKKSENKREVTNNELARMIKAGFDGVDQRFEAVDRRFDAVDKRFDAVERRLTNLEQNYSIVKKVKEALAL